MIWLVKEKNPISQQKYVPFAIVLLLGVKNGKNVGMRLSIVPKDVADRNRNRHDFVLFYVTIRAKPISLINTKLFLKWHELSL